MRTATGLTSVTRDQETMQAIVQDRYGTCPEDVLRFERIAKPTIKDDEVLVRVRAAGLDRGTWHLMAGLPYLARFIGFGLRAPKTPVPGLDVAGTVEAVGEGVVSFNVGDEVFGTAKSGSFAEFAVAKAGKLLSKPANLTFEQAAAVPVSASAALQAVRDKARIQPGERVLIIGASGGVGTYAVQIAKSCGAEVTGVASTAKLDLVRAIGADHVIDYTREDFTDGRRRYDVVIDIGGNRPISQLRRALAPKGRLVITGGEGGGPFLGGIERDLWAHLQSLFVSQKLGAFVSRLSRDDLLTIRELIESGAIMPAIDRTYPLGEAAAAIRHLAEGRARGKLVITV
ncbi:MAG: NAD(P)-dependent alcohol dehydrogenase [Actinomycetota bacterium]|nr:NAD(P)-dependent alcohol dehydrogenase [Actinomycetota bacterium]